MRYLVMSFPREHGIVVTWSGTLILSTIVASWLGLYLVGYLITTMLLFLVLFSADPFIDMLKGKTRSYPFLNILLIGAFSLVLLFLKFSLEYIMLLMVLALVSLSWAYQSMKKKYQHTIEISLGAATMGILLPLSILSSTRFISPELLGSIFFLGLTYSTINVLLVLHVDMLRKKISKTALAIYWLVALFLIVSSWIFLKLSFLLLLVLVEPTVTTLFTWLKKELPSNGEISLKRIGRNVSLRLLLYMIISLATFYYLLFF